MDGALALGQVMDARPGGWVAGAGVELAQQAPRFAGGDGEEAEVGGGAEAGAGREGVGAGVGAGALAAQALDDEDVEALAFDGQFQLQFYPPGAADEEVGQGDAKQAVPGGGGEGRLGELGVDGASRVANRARGGRIEYAKANHAAAP